MREVDERFLPLIFRLALAVMALDSSKAPHSFPAQNFKAQRSLVTTLSVKFKPEGPWAREVVRPVTDMHLFAKNAASEQQQRSPQTLLCGMRLTEARCSDTIESFVQLRRTRARRCSAGSSATDKHSERCARDHFQPFLPLTNTLRMPALLCDRCLSYEWLVSHRFCADNDDYDRAQSCCF